MCTKHFGANSLTKGKLFSTAANLQSRVGSYLISLAFTHLVISLRYCTCCKNLLPAPFPFFSKVASAQDEFKPTFLISAFLSHIVSA